MNELVKSENEIVNVEPERNNELTYCSIVCKTNEERKNLFNALEQADVLLNDVVGTEFELNNVYIHRYERINEETGEVEPKVRIILFDSEGKSYACGSFRIFNILRRMIEVFGTPDVWEHPLKVRVVKKDIKDNKKMLSLELI